MRETRILSFWCEVGGSVLFQTSKTNPVHLNHYLNLHFCLSIHWSRHIPTSIIWSHITFICFYFFPGINLKLIQILSDISNWRGVQWNEKIMILCLTNTLQYTPYVLCNKLIVICWKRNKEYDCSLWKSIDVLEN